MIPIEDLTDVKKMKKMKKMKKIKKMKRLSGYKSYLVTKGILWKKLFIDNSCLLIKVIYW